MHKEEEKEAILRKIWKEMSNVSREENTYFGPHNETMVNKHFEENGDQYTLYEYILILIDWITQTTLRQKSLLKKFAA